VFNGIFTFHWPFYFTTTTGDDDVAGDMVAYEAGVDAAGNSDALPAL
jgi:hypothetical protein